MLCQSGKRHTAVIFIKNLFSGIYIRVGTHACKCLKTKMAAPNEQPFQNLKSLLIKETVFSHLAIRTSISSRGWFLVYTKHIGGCSRKTGNASSHAVKFQRSYCIILSIRHAMDQISLGAAGSRPGGINCSIVSIALIGNI